MNTKEHEEVIDRILDCAGCWIDEKAEDNPEWVEIVPLVKAAPKLLEACKAIVRAIDAYEQDATDRYTLADFVYDCDGGEIPGRLRSAIKLATEGLPHANP